MAQMRVKVGMQTRLESSVTCEKQPWPHCGGPSNVVFPTPCRPRRQSHRSLFLLGFRLKLMSIAYFQTTTFVADGMPGRLRRSRPVQIVSGLGGSRSYQVRAWARGEQSRAHRGCY